MWKSARLSDNTFEDIPPSKVVLYYEAKACYRHVCKDLSGNSPARHGRFTGHKIYTWDIKVKLPIFLLLIFIFIHWAAITTP